MSAPTIDLHIERLVLDGLSTRDRGAVASAIERELGRLFAEHGVPQSLASGGASPALEGGTFDVPHGAGADAIGAHVARQLHQRMIGGGKS